jgi:kynureninase
MEYSTDRKFALALDRRDELAAFRSRFAIPEPELLYMDGNSLGRLPLESAARVRGLVDEQWGRDLIRGWNKGWYEAPLRLGDKIGRLVGAAAGQVAVSDSTSVNLFKLAAAALRLRPGRSKIVTDTLNFPSDLYILQGIAQSASAPMQVVQIPSADHDLTPNLDALLAAIDEDTALLTLSHVVFKSGYLYDMAAVTRRAHERGALVLWDLSHSAGVVPVELDACDVDFAIGCTYKYLNGGPGAPAFLYVNERLQSAAVSPIWGWFGQTAPFDFSLDYTPAPGIARFLAGTPPVLSLLGMEPGLDLTLEAGLPAIRRKSLELTEYFLRLSDGLLAPLGFEVGSPRQPERRGGHVSLRHAEGYRINRALIDEMDVIPDFREPDNIRFGFAPLYTRFDEIWQVVDGIRRVVAEERYLKYPKERARVT